MVFDDTEENVRYTGVPHLVVEVLSTDPWRDVVRKLRKYAEVGLSRYWIIDPEQPELVVYRANDIWGTGGGQGGSGRETTRNSTSGPAALTVRVGDLSR